VVFYLTQILTTPAENPKSDELSENKDDGDSGSGFKLSAGQNKTNRMCYVNNLTPNSVQCKAI